MVTVRGRAIPRDSEYGKNFAGSAVLSEVCALPSAILVASNNTKVFSASCESDL